ncbi:hypothetical protein MKK69_28970 [Methylobacterium sp. J-026]|uniref:hypothetical protein n=1 Tax=Methylobacterium sp. J-026 TaxID=2836624 RepID=UPI001FBA826B|nr:hypothetical protein [Methylobacterium sp. J-026]MCJ2138033.1 hypothetical protein [Methylobacterium sp. J-026]
MRTAETVIDNPAEAAARERAQQNSLGNGPGDRMWADPFPMKGSTMSAGFALSADQRATFSPAAWTEIASEGDTAERPEGPLLPSEGPRARLGILALYESPSRAQAATATLVAAGIPERAIRLVVAPIGLDDGRAEAGSSLPNGSGLQDRLETIGVAPEAPDACCARLKQGAAMLDLLVADKQRDRVMGILKDHGSVDPTLRLATWCAEGWGGTSPVSTEGWGGYSATSTGATDIATRRE